MIFFFFFKQKLAAIHNLFLTCFQYLCQGTHYFRYPSKHFAKKKKLKKKKFGSGCLFRLSNVCLFFV